MTKNSAMEIKRERKKSLYLQHITQIIQELAQEESIISQIYVSDVDISSDTGICYVLFSTFQDPGEEIFNQALGVLKLYKPSLRKAFAHAVQTRYAPNLVFKYDVAKERQRRIDAILDRVVQQREDSKNNK